MALVSIRLIDRWGKTFVQSWSNRIAAINAVILALFAAWPTAPVDIWAALPVFLQAYLPRHIALFMPLGLTALSMWARIVIQEKMRDGDPE